MTTPKVYADFQNLDGANRLRLTCAGTRQDLEQQGIQLQEGCVLLFYMDDANDRGQPDELIAEGTVRYNDQEECWVAEVDWGGLRHASDDLCKGRSPANRATVPSEGRNHQTGN